MKTILTILLFFTLGFAKAQSPNLYLDKAGRQLQTGFILTAGGSIVSVIGATLVTPANNFKAGEGAILTGVGIVATLAGAGFTYSGYTNIRRAGQVKQSTLHLTPSGMAYRF